MKSILALYFLEESIKEFRSSFDCINVQETTFI